MTLTLPAFLDALDQWLYEENEPMTAAELRDKIRAAREEVAQHPTPALGWSEWLDWAGGPCPLPLDTVVELRFADGGRQHYHRSGGNRWTHEGLGDDILRFRYRTDNPDGWLKRPEKWIPPDVLFDERCPVRCEWTNTLAGAHTPGKTHLGERWGTVGFIRLVAREAKAGEMPEGFTIDHDGWLIAPDGRVIFPMYHFHRYGPDAILAAVRAYLAEMARRESGNG